MSIATSVIIEDSIQVDGRRSIRERHTDHLGVTHNRTFIAPAEYDRDAGLAVNATTLAETLAQREIDANLAEIDNAEV